MINQLNRNSDGENNRDYKSFNSATYSRQSPGINKNNIKGAGKGV